MKQIISIATQKGGVGKSTLTICFANCLVSDNQKVLVIDCDNQNSIMDLYNYQKTDTSKPLFDVVSIYSAKKVFEYLKKNSKNYDYIFLDVPRFTENSKNSYILVSMCNVLIIPFLSAEIEILSLLNFLKVADTIKAENKDFNYFAIQNKVKRNNNYKTTAKLIGKKVNVFQSKVYDLKFFERVSIINPLLSSKEGKKRFLDTYNEFKQLLKIKL